MNDVRHPALEWKSYSVMLALWLITGFLAAVACSQKPGPGSASGRDSGKDDPSYGGKVGISHMGLAKGENYLGDSVHYVEGEIKNNGDRIVQRVELTLLFRDSLRQVVLKETRRALDYKASRGLEPQKSAKFQIGFDHLPKDWNYLLPEVTVSGVTLR